MFNWHQEHISTWIKGLAREVDHTRPSSVEVKSAWSYTPIPSYAFMVWCLIKQSQIYLYIYLVNFGRPGLWMLCIMSECKSVRLYNRTQFYCHLNNLFQSAL
jgi:hypothetical protein